MRSLMLLVIAVVSWVIRTDAGEKFALETATPESQGVSSAAIQRWLDRVERDIDAMHSFVLIRHGKVIAEGDWAPYASLEVPHALYSHSKSYTSTAIGFLYDEGKLDLDERVGDLLPESMPAEPSENLKELRVRDLLTMTCGGWVPHAVWGKPEIRDWKRCFLAKPMLSKPGLRFCYDSDATYLLAEIAELKSGEKLMDYLGRKLFAPLGMDSLRSNVSPDGTACGGWGMFANTRDNAKFGQFLLDEGVWRGQRLLSAEWIRMATARQADASVMNWGAEAAGYGFQFWRCVAPGAYRADGMYGQLTVVDPERDYVLSINAGTLSYILQTVWDVLLPAMGKEPLPEDAAALAALRKRCDALTLKCPKGNQDAALDAKLRGEWAVEGDAFGMKRVRIEPLSDGWRFAYEDQLGWHELMAGCGEWRPGELRLSAEDEIDFISVLPGLNPAATAAAWKDGIFTLRTHVVNAPLRLDFTLTPQADGTLLMTNFRVQPDIATKTVRLRALAPKAEITAENWAPPKPSAALAERLESDVDIIGIVHWGLNTYTDREWGFGDEDPKMLNPKNFDAKQIAQACADGGIRGLVIVAKHHDGFCLWPTKTTAHNITKAPFRGGKGDYVKEMADACRAVGIKFGVYCSPWDRNSADYATPKYVETFHAQVKELLDGRYGEVFEMWFDGANGGDGYYGGARERRKISGVDYYDFDTVFAFVRKLQPKVCIFTELRDDADFRWPCNELGVLDPDSRATIRPFDDDYMSYGNVGDVFGTVFHPCEADFPLRPGWFCHESQNADVKGGEYLMRLYLQNVGNGGTMNIGIAPSKDGTLHATDVAALKRFTAVRTAFFAHEVKDGGDFNVAVMSENLREGERVADWTLEAGTRTLAKGKAIGRRRIRVLDEFVAARDCRLVAQDPFRRPVPTTIRFYRVDPQLVQAVMSATDPGQGIDQHGVGTEVAKTAKAITYKFEATSKFERLRFAPDPGQIGGVPVEFRLAVSADGQEWQAVKGTYRLDNMAANPVPQILKLEESVEALYLRVEAVRTLKDAPIALVGVAIAR